jgi:hypothetical protein
MSQTNASKSGMGMWPGAYWLKSLSDALLALVDTDIICGGAMVGGWSFDV